MGPTMTGRFNNVYAGTEFYKTRDAGPTFTGNWIKQIKKIATDFPHSVFYRVHGATTAEIRDFDCVPNLKKMTIEDFVALINTPKDF